LRCTFLKIVLYEHVSSGGYAEKPIPQNVLSEGFGMLRSIALDFKSAGHEVTVLLDERISKLNPQIAADCTVPIFYAKEPQKFLQRIAKINDAIYIIAPETDGILQSLVELIGGTGKVSLNCESKAIAKVTDKTALYEKLLKLGVAPKTIILNMTDSLRKTKQNIKNALNYPLVLKPADGVSCSGLSLVKDEIQLERAIEKIKAESRSERFVAQEFVEGEDTSVSLLCNGEKAVAFSLNKQNVTLAEPDGISRYDGGNVPFDHQLKQEAYRAAERVVESIAGLRGYVGVDLILTQEKIFVVDVNPRLTTSYVGLRRAAGFNVAEAIVSTVLKGSLPTKLASNRYASFSKIDTKKPSVTAFHKAAHLDNVVSPPFPLNDSTYAASLVLGEGENLRDANLRLEEAKKSLLNIIS
jgi:predicted ATP-grasp superfamily ATP-dependent carboligase